MRNEFTAIVERDGPWYIAYCAGVPGANGQGETRQDCLDGLPAIPPEAGHEIIVTG
jgi:predicted RNase H-like HicB family nuclease